MCDENSGFDTKCLHGGWSGDPATMAKGVPVYRTGALANVVCMGGKGLAAICMGGTNALFRRRCAPSTTPPGLLDARAANDPSLAGTPVALHLD